jgi:chemotaxis protein methyltransferase CheR
VVNDTLKKMVSFEKHNLLGSDYPCNMDLILCRNVLIYFTDEGQEHVISGLASSLRPGGVLFMGATEAIFKCKEYGLSQICPFFYQRMP